MPRTSASFSPNPALRMASGQAVAGTSSLSSLSALTTPFDQNPTDPAAPALQGLGRLIDTLDRYLRLPSTPQAFMLYLAGLILIFTGALLNVMVAAQIMAAKIELAGLQRKNALIEQQNGDLIFQISRHQNLIRLQEQAISMGYGPATEREYFFVQDTVQTEVAPAMAAAPVQLAPVVTTPPASPDTTSQAPWRAWSDFLGLPVRAPSGRGCTQPRPEGARGDQPRPDLFTELSKQLERLGIR